MDFSRLYSEVLGYTEGKKMEVLTNLAQSVKEGNVIVEIGNFQGRSTIGMALSIKSAQKDTPVYSIDPHFDYIGVGGKQYKPLDKQHLYCNIATFNVGDLVSVICLPSHLVGRIWKERNIGLLWIDGNHSYSAVNLDCKEWLPLIVDNGYVMFDDVHEKGVLRAMEENINKYRVVNQYRASDFAWFQIQGHK